MDLKKFIACIERHGKTYDDDSEEDWEEDNKETLNKEVKRGLKKIRQKMLEAEEGFQELFGKYDRDDKGTIKIDHFK